MNAPEPVDEQFGGIAETRGGDYFADISAVPFPKGCDDEDCACVEPED